MYQVPILLRLALGLWVGGMLGYLVRILAVYLPVGVVGEELAKLGGIALVGKLVGRVEVRDGAMVGGGLGLTEMIFYVASVWSGGDIAAIGMRLFLTVPMHIVSGSVSARWRYGIVLAIIIHLMFNYLVQFIGK